MAILSILDGRAEAIFRGLSPGKGFPADLIRPTRRKLEMLHAAVSLNSLRAPPETGWKLWQAIARVSIQFA